MVPAVLQTKSVDLHVAVQVANALMVPAVPLPRSATVNVWDQGKSAVAQLLPVRGTTAAPQECVSDQGKSAVEATLSVHRKTALIMNVCK
jgi:hypothetical protein